MSDFLNNLSGQITPLQAAINKSTDGIPLTQQDKILLGKAPASQIAKVQLSQTQSPTISPDTRPTRQEALRLDLIGQRDKAQMQSMPPAYTPPPKVPAGTIYGRVLYTVL